VEIQLIKQAGGGFRPANQHDADALARIKTGALVNAEIKQPRNAIYHRRFFALLGFAYEYWQPGEVTMPDGTVSEAEKDINRFRKDALILAGYRKVVVNIKGEARYEAQSMSFAAMDETEFHDLYKAVFNVLWRLVLQHVRGMTMEVAERTMEEMLRLE
jgi:hypothetical protein